MFLKNIMMNYVHHTQTGKLKKRIMEKITKEDFTLWYGLWDSGQDMRYVSQISEATGLTKENCITIMRNLESLIKKYK